MDLQSNHRALGSKVRGSTSGPYLRPSSTSSHLVSSPTSPRKAPQASVTLAYDLGGTKVEVGVVNRSGQILESERVPARTQDGAKELIEQLAQIGLPYLEKYSEIDAIGLASAGPLDPKRGTLLDPTNMFQNGKSLGEVPISSELEKLLERPVYLENDAAASILAEQWVGAASDVENAMVLTLGTGLGTGIICNGQLVRAGRGLHPEAGHIVIGAGDETAPCACGNLGCAEAYLSGSHFERRAKEVFGLDKHLRASQISQKAREKDPKALKAFDDYCDKLAIAITSYVVLYAPEKIIFAGSFAKAGDLFIEPTQEKLVPLLERRRVGVDLFPELTISPLKNHSGILGGAKVVWDLTQAS